nr:TonB-dependent receptor plug domain-containing protein [Oleiagrimonas sp. C23AA]
MAAQPDAAASPATTAVQQSTSNKAAKAKIAKQQASDLQTVVVTGFRQSIHENLEQKRNSNAVVEVINAQNISQFPAKNIADALQRVPGVIISRSEGEGKTVSIRGLAPQLTLTELNGNYVASADTSAGLSRSFNYLLLPSNMFSSVKMYKSQQSSLDEGGIGGVVELHTRRPLEMPSNKGFVSVEASGEDANHKTEPSGSALYSWHNKDDTFGFLLGGTYRKRHQTEYSANASSWHWWANDYDAQPPTNVHGNQFNPI